MGESYYEIGIQIPLLGNMYKLSNFTIIRRVLLMGFPFL